VRLPWRRGVYSEEFFKVENSVLVLVPLSFDGFLGVLDVPLGKALCRSKIG
jgi:hypothetical protein